jgi:hypothetical protein
MSSHRPILPIAAVVAVLGLLVGIRVWGGDPADAEGAGSRSTTSTTAPPGAGHTDGIRFTDVTRAAGLALRQSTEARAGESAMTSGAAVADVDGDGDPDVYLTRIGAPDALLLNDGHGHFTDATKGSGAGGADPQQGSSAAAFADVDGDGHLDLVVTAAGRGGLTLLRGDGHGHFTDITATSGFDLPPLPAGVTDAQLHGLTFADYDRDGRLDLLVTNWDSTIPAALADPAADDIAAGPGGSLVCARAAWLRAHGFPRAAGAPPNRGRLFHNDGGGHFTDVTSRVGLAFDQVLGFTGQFQDVDGDGWPDLLLTGDFCTSRLYRNDGGTHFTDVTDAAHVGTDENGMGSVVRDVDGDGRPDWFVTSIGPISGVPRDPSLPTSYGHSGNRLYAGAGDGTFTDATDRYGVRAGGWGWGAAIEDFGNDGRLEVVMTNGYDIDGTGARSTHAEAVDPMRFWMPAPGRGLPYVERSGAVGLTDDGLGHGLVAFDADGDGDLDVLVARSGPRPILYRNDTPHRHWIDVRLDDPAHPGNRAGVGATVVVTPAGGRAVTQWVRTDGSYESQRPAQVHVGLGTQRPGPVRIEVTWPDGGPPQVETGVAPDRVVTVRRG